MRGARIVFLGALVLLSISTGLTKLVRMPAEMELFAGAGFSDEVTIGFGVVQLLGGLLLLRTATRRIGAVTMAMTFSIATVVVFINGMIPFGVASLLFIAAALYHVRHPELPESA